MAARQWQTMQAYARHVGIHYETLRRLAVKGELPGAVKLGHQWRVDPEVADAYVAGRNHVVSVDDYVAQLVAQAPRLTDSQRDQLRELLRDVRVSGAAGTSA